ATATAAAGGGGTVHYAHGPAAAAAAAPGSDGGGDGDGGGGGGRSGGDDNGDDVIDGRARVEARLDGSGMLVGHRRVQRQRQRRRGSRLGREGDGSDTGLGGGPVGIGYHSAASEEAQAAAAAATAPTAAAPCRPTTTAAATAIFVCGGCFLAVRRHALRLALAAAGSVPVPLPLAALSAPAAFAVDADATAATASGCGGDPGPLPLLPPRLLPEASAAQHILPVTTRPGPNGTGTGTAPPLIAAFYASLGTLRAAADPALFNVRTTPAAVADLLCREAWLATSLDQDPRLVMWATGTFFPWDAPEPGVFEVPARFKEAGATSFLAIAKLLFFADNSLAPLTSEVAEPHPSLAALCLCLAHILFRALRDQLQVSPPSSPSHPHLPSAHNSSSSETHRNYALHRRSLPRVVDGGSRTSSPRIGEGVPAPPSAPHEDSDYTFIVDALALFAARALSVPGLAVALLA
ncbi:hypothetical protein HK405_011605, partial [Cladochytrium tenue]